MKTILKHLETVRIMLLKTPPDQLIGCPSSRFIVFFLILQHIEGTNVSNLC